MLTNLTIMITIKNYLYHKLKILSKYHVPRTLILWIDSFLSFLALLLTFILINSSTTYFDVDDHYWMNFGIIFIIQVVSIVSFRSYLGIIRYTNLKDAFKQIQSILFTVFVIFCINIVCDFFNINRLFPNSGVVVYGFIAFTFLFFYRIIIKQTYHAIHKTNSISKNVYVLGTSLTDVAIAESINNDAQTDYQLAGFISESNSLKKKRILDLPILSLNEAESSDTHNTIIVTGEKLKRFRKNDSKILNILLNKNFNIYKLPEIENWDEDSILSNIKKVKLEDLLQRNPIKLNRTKLQHVYNDKTILVTGAAGSIGSDIVKQLVSFHPKKILMLDNAETPLHEMSLYMKDKHDDVDFESIIADVRNVKRLKQVFEFFNPEIVFHGAAYKHVPMMECNPIEAMDVNFCGTKNLADSAVEYHVERFVFVSTDKAVNPTNIMGASKRAAELYVQSKSRKSSETTFITTRFGNVLGSNGSVIPHFKKQIENKEAITVTHPEITRYFMTIDEAGQLLLEAGAMGNGGEIYVFDMGKPVKILELAKNMIRLSGLTPDVDIDIKFIGLRPGEKLYEELLADKENTLPTHHQKILIAQASYDFDNTKIKLLSDLIYFIKDNDQNKSIKALKLLVPEFKSQSFQEETEENASQIL